MSTLWSPLHAGRPSLGLNATLFTVEWGNKCYFKKCCLVGNKGIRRSLRSAGSLKKRQEAAAPGFLLGALFLLDPLWIWVTVPLPNLSGGAWADQVPVPGDTWARPTPHPRQPCRWRIAAAAAAERARPPAAPSASPPARSSVRWTAAGFPPPVGTGRSTLQPHERVFFRSEEERSLEIKVVLGCS